MRKIMIAVALGCLSGGVYAADLPDLQAFGVVDIKAGAAQYAVPAPQLHPASVETQMPWLTPIIYVPAHYGILVYEAKPQISASWYSNQADAIKDMDKLILAFQKYGAAAQGTVQEDYWHGWGFVVSYSPGTVTELSAKKYISKTDAEMAALKWAIKMTQAQTRQRPLAPVVATEQLDNGVAYRVKLLCYNY